MVKKLNEKIKELNDEYEERVKTYGESRNLSLYYLGLETAFRMVLKDLEELLK